MSPIHSRATRPGGTRAGAAVILALAASSLLGAAPALAHHSFGLYDMTKSVQLDGTVSKLEWSNPHCWLFVVSNAANGTEATYGFEMSSVGEMVRKGWKKNALKPGDKVRVTFHPVRDGRTAGYLTSVLTAAGQYIGPTPAAGGAGGPGAPAAPAPAAPAPAATAASP